MYVEYKGKKFQVLVSAFLWSSPSYLYEVSVDKNWQGIVALQGPCIRTLPTHAYRPLPQLSLCFSTALFTGRPKLCSRKNWNMANNSLQMVPERLERHTALQYHAEKRKKCRSGHVVTRQYSLGADAARPVKMTIFLHWSVRDYFPKK